MSSPWDVKPYTLIRLQFESGKPQKAKIGIDVFPVSRASGSNHFIGISEKTNTERGRRLRAEQEKNAVSKR